MNGCHLSFASSFHLLLLVLLMRACLRIHASSKTTINSSLSRIISIYWSLAVCFKRTRNKRSALVQSTFVHSKPSTHRRVSIDSIFFALVSLNFSLVVVALSFSLSLFRDEKNDILCVSVCVSVCLK